MNTKGHMTIQPGIRAHSFGESNLLGRFKMVDTSKTGRQYIGSAATEGEIWTMAQKRAAGEDVPPFEVVDSGTGPWPTETVIGYF